MGDFLKIIGKGVLGSFVIRPLEESRAKSWDLILKVDNNDIILEGRSKELKHRLSAKCLSKLR